MADTKPQNPKAKTENQNPKKESRLPNTRFTKENVDELLKLIKLLVPTRIALKAIGVSMKTFNQWCNQKRRVTWKVEIGKDAEGIPIMGKPQFDSLVKKAEAQGVGYNLQIIQDAAPKTWTAAAWILERRFSEYFGKVERIRHSGGGRGHPPVPDEAREAMEKLDSQSLRMFKDIVQAARRKASQKGKQQGVKNFAEINVR